MSRYQLSQKDFSKFDQDLNRSVDRLREKLPNDWEIVMGYLRSLALPTDIDPSAIEMVKYHYHTKSFITRVVKRLSGLEEIGE
jgi:hypothetical protein